MHVPHGVQNLFIACHDSRERQFQRLGTLLRVLARRQLCHLRHWDGLPLDLARRRVLTRVLISGHGSERTARFAVADAAPLEPHCLNLSAGCRLYLLGCNQGSAGLLQAWAEGTGIPLEQAAGCGGETDTAVTTCLLLNLLENGIDSLEGWFPLWVGCNDALRPWFPEIRRAYADHGADPVATLQSVRRLAPLEPFEGFLGVIERHPEYLRGLVVT